MDLDWGKMGENAVDLTFCCWYLNMDMFMLKK